MDVILSYRRRLIELSPFRFTLRNAFDEASYYEIYSLLDLHPLEDRRTVFFCIFVGDLLSGRIDGSTQPELLNLKYSSMNLRQKGFLDLPFHRTNYSCARAND